MGEMADYYRRDEDEWLSNNNYIHPDKAELHRCANGTLVCINGQHPQYDRMEDSHLINTIKWIERRAEEGIMLETGPAPVDIEMMIEMPVSIYGDEVLDYLKYKRYIKEAKKRKLKWQQ